MEAKAMERLRPIMEAGDALILAIMAIFTFLKQSINEAGKINWTKGFVKIFTNFVAGWGFYYAIIAYWTELSQYPQKVPAIMVATYAGSRLIDIVVDKIYQLNFKNILRKWLED
jgi:hypothetical protein